MDLSDTPDVSSDVNTATVDVSDAAADPVAAIMARKKPNTITVPIVLNPEWAVEFDTARREYELAKVAFDTSPSNPDLAVAYEAAKGAFDKIYAELGDNIVEFKFAGISPRAYDALIALNPATEQQKREARKEGRPVPTTNNERFHPAVLAASSASPKLTFEQANAIFDDPAWNHSEVSALLEGALLVNQRHAVVSPT